PNAVKPTRADHEMPRTQGAHKVFARQLAQPVDAHRSRRIVLGPGNPSLLIEAENVVGAEMHQRATEVAANQGQVAHGPGVDGESGQWLRLGLVHKVVRGAVENHVRT